MPMRAKMSVLVVIAIGVPRIVVFRLFWVEDVFNSAIEVGYKFEREF